MAGLLPLRARSAEATGAPHETPARRPQRESVVVLSSKEKSSTTLALASMGCDTRLRDEVGFWRSDQADAVILANRARCLSDGVHAGAGVERAAHVDPVVLGEGLENP